MGVSELCCLDDFERHAKQTLAADVWAYIDSGSDDEVTKRLNRRALDETYLWYRVMADANDVTLDCRVGTADLSMPLLIAPSALHRLSHPDGEIATARAAAKAGIAFVLSTMSSIPVEEVTAVAPDSVWFQLYLLRDRGLTAQLVNRAREAGCKALVLTVDAPRCGRRRATIRRGLRLPEGVELPHVASLRGADPKYEDAMALFDSLIDPSVTWSDVEWLKATAGLPVYVKGIIRPDDAVEAAARGVDGVIVSNHGGRQLDTSPPTIEALRVVGDALKEQNIPLLVDGGFRRGTDIVKAIALGADAALIGRPAVWGLACGGETGLTNLLDLLREEIEIAMALCGCRCLSEIGPRLLEP